MEDGSISDCKSVGVLPSAITQNSRKFEPIPQSSKKRLAEGSVKTRTIRKQELSTCNNFLWTDIYIKYIQCESCIKNIYNIVINIVVFRR